MAIIIAMKHVHLYLHLFDRLFFDEYGQAKLSTAQDILFQVIGHEFRKNFPQYFDDQHEFNSKFLSSFSIMEELLAGCGCISPENKEIV